MSVTLYYGSGSPYAWRVWLALEYKNVPHELKVLSFDAGDHKAPAFTAINPRQKVPLLVDGDFALSESAAIMEYIEDRWPQAPRLFSADLQQRAVQRRMIREADGYVGDVMRQISMAVFAPAQGDGKDPQARITEAATALQRELARWEPALTGDYLAGALSAVDFTLYPHLALLPRIDKRKPGTLPADLFGPKLSAWMERMTALPIVQKTWPPHWK